MVQLFIDKQFNFSEPYMNRKTQIKLHIVLHELFGRNRIKIFRMLQDIPVSDEKGGVSFDKLAEMSKLIDPGVQLTRPYNTVSDDLDSILDWYNEIKDRRDKTKKVVNNEH